MIQGVRADGWIRLSRGGIKRSNTRAGCVSLACLAVVMFVGLLVLGSLRVFPLLTFLLLGAVMVLWAWVFSAIQERLWGTSVAISLSRHPVRAGESFRVRWMVGRPERVDDLIVTWEGHEVAIFRGYDSSTFVEPFSVHTLDAAAREGTVEIPSDAMPSFKGKNVRIDWVVSVESLRGTTSTVEHFPVLMLPSR